MLKRTDQTRPLCEEPEPGWEVKGRTMWSVHGFGSLALLAEKDGEGIVLSATEIVALRDILTEDDPLAGLEVMSYRLEEGVVLFRLHDGSTWGIHRQGEALDKEGAWAGDHYPRRPDGRWPTAEAALAAWQARKA